MYKKLIIVFLGIMLLPVSGLYAHPPGKVVLSYDQDSQALTVEVVHRVSNPGRHFVNRIEVLRNGEMVVDGAPSRQDETTMRDVYTLSDVQPGDVLQATAFCNMGGKRSGKIQIA